MVSVEHGPPDLLLARVTEGWSGIGLELARKFAGHGFDLVIADASDWVDSAAAALRAAGATASMGDT